MPFNVLVVDDEPDLEMLIRQRFRRKVREGQYEFLFARNGREALAALEREPGVDVVMSDINMPVMDGLTLLSRLKDMPQLMKSVIVSAYGDMPNIRTAMNRGAFDFLTKPIDFRDFEVTLDKAIEELEAIREGVQAQERLAKLHGELSIAARIQQSILPREFPPAEAEGRMDIHAAMIPARQVGGDFYDVFMVGPGQLGFAVGDVTGKGVPAAIFMAVCRTLLRATALQGMSPGDCLGYVNTVLARESDSAVFVTVFYGILDTVSGELQYSNGGHNPPFLVRSAGTVHNLGDPRSLVVGAFAGAEYETGRTCLYPGEVLFLYTDGLTEAIGDADEEFSEDRLVRFLADAPAGPAESLVQSAISAVKSFAGDHEQSDDLTVMALKPLGAPDPSGERITASGERRP